MGFAPVAKQLVASNSALRTESFYGFLAVDKVSPPRPASFDSVSSMIVLGKRNAAAAKRLKKTASKGES